jgi:transcriptional regulator with XRE-family HTH domain
VDQLTLAAAAYIEDEEVRELRQWLHMLRQTRGVNFQQVADQIGVSRSLVSQFAHGKKKDIGPDIIAKLKQYRQNIGDLPSPVPAEGTKRRLEFTVTENVRLTVYLCHECATKK